MGTDEGVDNATATYSDGDSPTLAVPAGKYQLFTIDMKRGTIRQLHSSIRIDGTFTPQL